MYIYYNIEEYDRKDNGLNYRRFDSSSGINLLMKNSDGAGDLKLLPGGVSLAEISCPISNQRSKSPQM